MSGNRCVYCGQDARKEVEFSDQIANGRRRFSVDGLRKMVCTNCGESTVSRAQAAHNASLIEAAVRDIPTLVTPAFIRNLREIWDITQRQASKLFGAGDNAFAKWESGQVPSGPAALLIQCAIYVPGVMEFLAKLANLELGTKNEDKSAKLPSYRTHSYVQVKTDCVSKRRLSRKLMFGGATVYRTDRLSVGGN